MYHIIDLLKNINYSCKDKMDTLLSWKRLTSGAPAWLQESKLKFHELNVTGKDMHLKAQPNGHYWNTAIHAYLPTYETVCKLKRFQVIDDKGRSIDIRTWTQEIAAVNTGYYPDVARIQKLTPAFRREPAEYGRKDHAHRKGGCTMWRASMREVFCGDDDELTEFRPVIDHSKFRDRGFTTSAGWNNYERRHYAGWASSKCWKDQSKSGRQWAQHKRGVSGKAIRDKRCPEPYMDIAEACADIIAG